MRLTPRRLRCWLPAAIWMGVIFLASTDLFSVASTGRFLRPILQWLLPGLSESALDLAQFAVRKLAHMTEYAILAGLVFSALRRSAGFSSWRWDWRHSRVAWLVCLAYAAFDEIHQTTVASRTGSIKDVCWDAAGAALWLAIIWLAHRWRPAGGLTKGLPDAA